MTQAHTPSSSSGSAPLAQAWDDLIKWLSNAPPSVQAQAVQNPQATLAQHGLAGVSGPQLQSAITNSGSFNNSGHTVNQGSGNTAVGNHFGAGSVAPCPPGAPPSDVFNYYVSNNYSSIVDNSIKVAGDMNGDIDQHNVTGNNNTTTFGDEFDIDGDVNGQIVTGDHSNAAGHDLDASVMGAGATHVGDGNSFGNGTNFGSGTSSYTDNRGAHIDNSDHSTFTDNSGQDNSTYSDSSMYTDSSDHSSYVDSSDHSVDNSGQDHSVDNSEDHSRHTDTGGGDLDVHGNSNF